jgi:ATP-dependent RNA helicase DeaD
LLVHLLRQENPDYAIIFCNSRRDVDSVCRNLQRNRINADALHGGLSQGRREKVIGDFHGRRIDVLVATDVAARGLDFKKVTHIFNYSVPINIEEYVNRIGRTARAGESGKAIVLLSREDYDSFNRVINTFNFDIQPMEYSDVEVLPFMRNNYSQRDEAGYGQSRRDGNGYGKSRRDGNGYGNRRRSYGRNYNDGNGGQPFRKSFNGNGATHSCADIEALGSAHNSNRNNQGETQHRSRRGRYN